ncbi:hypothetical protein Ahy_A02g007204 [Arachis hypogaea]|uniref:Eukaryotic translation initiation factor isoform 4E n=1 Tax=Arachis hypogaea TaxID=3818 RepID=A0A445EC15_ARAHY|nr:hypothetical protein Ahy_A02g007204 [Arachis hypogaea]
MRNPYFMGTNSWIETQAGEEVDVLVRQPIEAEARRCLGYLSPRGLHFRYCRRVLVVFKPSKLPGNADFHLFKAGIEPKWEDPECAKGGKWTVTSNRKANLDNMWLETMMALIGEQFDDAEDICGVVASVRQRQDKLSLWTKTAANEAAQMGIGRKWKEIIDVTDKIIYNFHDDSRTRSSKSRYSV